MKNFIKMKRIAVFVVSLVLLPAVFIFPDSVFATEKKYCDVTFIVSNETQYEDSILVGFLDGETGQSIMPLELNYANSYGSGKPLVYSVPFGKVYNLEFLIAEGFIVVSADDSPAPKSIKTDKDSIVLYLKIVILTDENAPPKPTTVNANSPQDVFDLDRIANTDKEGNAAFREFIEIMNPTALDFDWKGFYDTYEMGFEVKAKDYELYTGRPAQEYIDMNNYERFLIQETYITIYKTCLASDMRDYYFGNEQNYLARTIRYAVNSMKLIKTDTTQEQEAYIKLMLWQYQYVMEHGLPYSYITGFADPTAVDVFERETGIKVVLPNMPQDDSANDDFGDFGEYMPPDPDRRNMASSVLPIIIIIVVVAAAALLFFIWKRRKTVR